MPDALVAESGFSALVRVEKPQREHTILFDTGISPIGLAAYVRRLASRSGTTSRAWRAFAGALGRANLPPGALEPVPAALPGPRPGGDARAERGRRGDRARGARTTPPAATAAGILTPPEAETDILRRHRAFGTLPGVDEEQGIYRGEVLTIMGALADIYTDTSAILALLEGEEDDGEEVDG